MDTGPFGLPAAGGPVCRGNTRVASVVSAPGDAALTRRLDVLDFATVLELCKGAGVSP